MGASGRWEHLGKSSACPVKTQLAELTFAAKNRLRVNLPKAARSESIEGFSKIDRGEPHDVSWMKTMMMKSSFLKKIGPKNCLVGAGPYLDPDRIHGFGGPFLRSEIC